MTHTSTSLALPSAPHNSRVFRYFLPIHFYSSLPDMANLLNGQHHDVKTKPGTHTQTQTDNALTRAYTYVHTLPNTHTCRQCPCMRVHICTHTTTLLHTHTYAHTYAHKHLHTRTPPFPSFPNPPVPPPPGS